MLATQRILVGIEQGAVWARRRVTQRTEPDAHVHYHSHRGEMAEGAREWESGGHLLHQRHRHVVRGLGGIRLTPHAVTGWVRIHSSAESKQCQIRE